MAVSSPASRPAANAEQIRSILAKRGITDKVVVIGIRGYYRDSMGKPGVNDRGIYDDALFIISPDYFRAYNANTDPSVARKGIASLSPGVWRYKPGIHGISRPIAQQYAAFRQASNVTVIRDGGKKETGQFGINIHRGSINSTSSEGCQTIKPDQWEEFRGALNRELAQYGQESFPYILIEGPIR
ncbi:hypothetical protein EON81_09330 [bacterium]|nr:MAG: hypothetical protein EON81_09330 [bacterium]